jgi:hypothetical protein
MIPPGAAVRKVSLPTFSNIAMLEGYRKSGSETSTHRVHDAGSFLRCGSQRL